MKKDGIGNYFLSVIRGWDIIKRMNWNTERRANQALEIYVDSCGKKSLGETPQCFSTRSMTSVTSCDVIDTCTSVYYGGSPAPRGKRSIFPERIHTQNNVSGLFITILYSTLFYA